MSRNPRGEVTSLPQRPGPPGLLEVTSRVVVEKLIFGGLSLGQPQKMLVGSSLISLRSWSMGPGSMSS